MHYGAKVAFFAENVWCATKKIIIIHSVRFMVVKMFDKTYPVAISWRLAVALLMVAVLPLSVAARPQDKLYNRPYADLKRWHLGFSVGTHVQDLEFVHKGVATPSGEVWYAEVPDFSPGFCVNVLADLRLHNNFNLRFSPGIYFGNRVVRFLDQTTGAKLSQDLKSSYIVAPLDLKISGNRLGDTRPYITVGAMGTLDISKKRSDYLRLKPMDGYLTVGLGCDFYLPFFKLIPEIKFCFGLSDVLVHKRPDLTDNPETLKITESLKKVKSNMVVLSFYFE